LAPGNKDFTRYTTPALCVAAAENAMDLGHRAIANQVRPELLPSADTRSDSLPSAVRTVARTCGARFTPEAFNDDRTLRAVFTLALWSDQDSRARVALERRLTLATTPAARALVLREATEAYLAVPPGRVTAAAEVLAQFDALGPTTAAARLWAYQALLDYAWKRFDEPLLRKTAERIIALGQAGPLDSIRYDYLPIIRAYRALGELAYLQAPDSVTAVAARAKQDLGRFPPASQFPPGKQFHDLSLEMINYRTAQVQAVRLALLPFDAVLYADAPPPPVTATYWIPRPPSGWPPGRPAVVIYGGPLPNGCARSDEWIFNPVGNHGLCDPLYTTLPHWFARYGDRLSVTLVAQTAGRAVRSGIVSPAAEADSLGWFFREHLELPVTVGVVTSSVRVLPAPDGRQFRTDTTFYGPQTGPHGQTPVVLLYGARGELVFKGDNMWSPVLQRLIEREVRAAETASRAQRQP
jgi:hypothetical protein